MKSLLIATTSAIVMVIVWAAASYIESSIKNEPKIGQCYKYLGDIYKILEVKEYGYIVEAADAYSAETRHNTHKEYINKKHPMFKDDYYRMDCDAYERISSDVNSN